MTYSVTHLGKTVINPKIGGEIMVYLAVAEEMGSSLYFDIHRVEACPGGTEAGFIVSGIIGDGFYEGEVQVEVASGVDTIFLDDGLNPPGFTEFLDRFGREEVCAALGEAALSCKL
jgi:hypothetical protein